MYKHPATFTGRIYIHACPNGDITVRTFNRLVAECDNWSQVLRVLRSYEGWVIRVTGSTR